jgi:preprotein translocase subunit SecE
VARDRKRAKQRRQRRPPGSRGPSATQPTRSEVPGALDHASGEADEFEAALVRGAGGAPAPPDAAIEAELDAEVDTEHISEGEVEAEALAEGSLSQDELQEPAGSTGRRAPGGGARSGVTPEQASGAPIRGGNRVAAFLRASWAELQRVQWPDRRQVTQATAVVLGFVAVAGAYLGLADFVAKEIVEFIL